jgi:hypothetical protein
MPAPPDRRQAVEDKKKGRIIYKGLWTDEEDQMLRSLVEKMADLPRSAPASCCSALLLARAASPNLGVSFVAVRMQQQDLGVHRRIHEAAQRKAVSRALAQPLVA